jgi:para-aminobenzoate synthetase / 4-amino-4-deoxychorismate lyase
MPHDVPLASLTRLVSTASPVVLLDTARSSPKRPSSYLFVDPIDILCARTIDEVLPVLEEVSRRCARHWLAGYIAYEAAFALEKRLASLARHVPTGPTPLVWFGVYSTPHIFDHRSGRWSPHLPALASRAAAAPAASPLRLRRLTSATEYGRAIDRIKRYIAAGDTYQVNYTFDTRVTTPDAPWDLYCALRNHQRVPYGAFVSTDDITLLSFSPELFFERQLGAIRTKPMKGTAPRGATPQEDRSLRDGLARDPKNQAENVMIVDLLRNDLGRICRTGSVRVERLFELETHATLHQMTSTVRGTLRPGTSFADIMRALFPCGSVTGAPKLRTMEIIDELERGRRGVYCGALGYLAPRGRAAFSVPIRTLQRTRGERHWRYRVGSGVIWDSRADEEWRECETKTAMLTRREPGFEVFESMLWRAGRYRYLDDHTRRLVRSARNFAFPVSTRQFLEFARRAARTFDDGRPRKVRVFLNSAGAMRWDAEAIASAGETAAPTALLSATPIDSSEPLLYHKTTHRPWYQPAVKRIRAHACFDVIFTNRRGEITEGARSNVFAELKGKLYTPPVRCGVLPGVLRGRLLKSGACGERVLTVGDLRAAEALYCGNSVRGLVRVRLADGHGKRLVGGSRRPARPGR